MPGSTSEYLPLIVLLPLLGAMINGLMGKHLPKGVVTFTALAAVFGSFFISCLAVADLAIWAEHVHDQPEVYPALHATVWTWIDSGWLTVTLSFLLDPLSAVMLLVVTGVGSLIHVFSVGYMGSDKAYWRYFAYLNLFMFAMLLLILGDNALVLFVGWEGVGLCSYLLIGFWYDDMHKAAAGQKAFIVNRIGDFCFLLGLFLLLYYTQGDLDFLRLREVVGEGGALQDEGTITLICLLFFAGAAGKSAQIPLYVWLPDAMAGPTPVSALIHAATMVTAGVYMMCRLSFLFAAAPSALAIIALVGGATALLSATIALVQNDIKKVLAYSTVSQLGFMVLGVGVGAFVAAIFHLMTHAFFKACLFLGSGSVIHALHHEQDIRQMGGLKERLPVTRWTFLASCIAIAGIPPLAGFWSKDEILFVAFTSQHPGVAPILYKIAWAMGMLAALGTAFYMFRLYYLTFEGEYRGDPHVLDDAHEESVMVWPLRILGILAIGGGLVGTPWAHVFGTWLEPSLAGGMEWFHYSHDHGLEYTLMGVSAAIAVAGWFIARKVYLVPHERLPVAPVGAAWHRTLMNKWYVDELYEALITGPLRHLAGILHRVADVRLIDGLAVVGTARAIKAFGDLARRVQTGDVQTYATLVAVGTAILLAFFVE